MKRLLSFLPLVFLFVFFVLPISSLSTTRGIKVTSKHGQSLYLYKDYYALVVGIGNYERWPRLPNAVNDAREVASKLRKLGFEVKLVLDPTAREMRTELSEMVYKMGREENRALLFYYAGHGETEKLADKTKMGYIVPKDCPLLERDPMGFATHAISMRDIESVSLRIRAKHVIMLFDSCFSGSLFSLVRAVPADITEKSALPVRQYITAGREDEQVPDKSMFKRCLLIGLEGDADLTGDGYITGSELGMYLSDKVVNYTHRRQHPQYGKINNPDLDRGDFIFVPVRERQKGISEGEEPGLDADSYFNRGLTYAKNGQYDRAISDFNKAIEINPKFARAYTIRGAIYVKNGQYDRAISDFNKAIEINPKYARAYAGRGIAYVEKGQYDKAISDFTKAIELNPRYALAYFNRGNAYSGKGQYDQALSDYNKAIELNPRYADAYNNRGNAYDEKGQYDKAISDFSKAIEINPRHAFAYNNRGLAYGKGKGQYDKAISDFSKAIEINPRYADAYNSRGVAYFFKREYEKAWDDVHKAQNLGDQIHPGFLKELREASGRER